VSLWDSPVGIETEHGDRLRNLKALSPHEFREAYAARLVTHCEHGRIRTAHCPWCYVQTPAYRQSLADAMRTTLD
jgi:hypothetical protein